MPETTQAQPREPGTRLAVLIPGGHGQLGAELRRLLGRAGDMQATSGNTGATGNIGATGNTGKKTGDVGLDAAGRPSGIPGQHSGMSWEPSGLAGQPMRFSGQAGGVPARSGRYGGFLVHAPGSAEFDITDGDFVTGAVSSFAESARQAGCRPVVINAAAYTNVDAAESEPGVANRVNAEGPALLAAACESSGTPLVHVSTDYVFSGDAAEPYEPDDAVDPRTAYGRTKLDGERAVLNAGTHCWVVRTSWVYGGFGDNFVTTMARLESEQAQLSVVDDQVGCPTWAGDLAGGLLALVDRIVAGDGPRRKVLHVANSGSASWYEFARAIFTELGAAPERIAPCTSAEFPRPAPRPAYSVLSGAAWQEEGLPALRPWRDALSAAFTVDGDKFPASRTTADGS